MQTYNQDYVQYYLEIGDDFLDVNSLIGKKVKINYKNKRKCFCGDTVESTFRFNFCYDCFYKLPQASESIMKPELCKAHLDIEVRDLEWEKEFELKPHIVYLAVSSNLKVGITRKSQIPTRWIDQGAEYAIEFAEVPNRFLSGKIEVALKKLIDDKTNWQKMLKESAPVIDLLEKKKLLFEAMPDDTKQYFLDQRNDIVNIKFPIEKLPKKVKSLNLAKDINYVGILSGIKGQYLIFDDGSVLNIRNHEGFIVDFEIE